MRFRQPNMSRAFSAAVCRLCFYTVAARTNKAFGLRLSMGLTLQSAIIRCSYRHPTMWAQSITRIVAHAIQSREVLMSPISKSLASAAVAALLATPAGAQVVTQKNVSLALAQAIANAAIAQCRTMGYKASVSVVDRDGIPIVLLHDDGAGLSTNEGSDRKAYTAASFKQPSAAFVKRMHDQPDSVGSRHYTRILALAGGLPIKVGDDVIGAVGVSGTPGKDDVCAQAGIDKVADQLK
jgi:uncharacterized protein GlcG (DUF336 family)